MAIHYMTQEGLDKLKKDLADAVAQRPVISAQIAEARDKGDLSENAEYEAAREAQGLLELNIAKLQDLVANARVIDESQIGTEKVQMLNKVKVKNLSNGMVMEFDGTFQGGDRRGPRAVRCHQVRDTGYYIIDYGNSFHKDRQGRDPILQGGGER